MGYGNRDEDITPGFAVAKKTREWKQPLLRESWEPLEVIGRVRSYQDFAEMSSVPAFSQRACNELMDILLPNGELLPLKSDTEQTYFLYNTTRIADVLDEANSECSYFRNPARTASDIRYFAFHADKLDGLTIFRIPQFPRIAMVTDHFVERVIESQLPGFSFTKIWPIAEGVNWRVPRQLIETADTDRRKLTRETLILCFRLKRNEITQEEDEQLLQIGKDLESALAVESLTDMYYGTYEVAGIENGELRMFISTPSTETLLNHLTPWIKSQSWPDEI